MFIGFYICLFPSPCLIPAGDNKDKSYILMDFSAFNNGLGSESIELM